jgi:hypothetical protein
MLKRLFMNSPDGKSINNITKNNEIIAPRLCAKNRIILNPISIINFHFTESTVNKIGAVAIRKKYDAVFGSENIYENLKCDSRSS